MAFEAVGFPKMVPYTSCQPGDIMLTGYFVGTREGVYGPIHVFRTEAGELVAIPKSGGIDNTIRTSVAVGDFCQVTFNGKKVLNGKSKFAGKDFNDVSIAVDPDRSISAGKPVPSTPSLPVNQEPEIAAPKAGVATTPAVAPSEDDDGI